MGRASSPPPPPSPWDLSNFTNADECYEYQTDIGDVEMNSHQLVDTLTKCKLNWFQFVEVKTEMLQLSALLTTSYNFWGNNTTRELCAGIVKAPVKFEKNPTKHGADFRYQNAPKLTIFQKNCFHLFR